MPRIVEDTGFELLKTIDVEEALPAATAQPLETARDVGADPVSGGSPVKALVAFDVLPWRISSGIRRYPACFDNGRTHEVMVRCREFIEGRLPPERRFDPLKSTHSSREAWDVVRRFSPADEQELRETIQSRRSAMETHFEVVRNLTRLGSRSKVELIRYGSGLAIKKTYRHSCLRFMERETTVMDTFSPERPEIPPVLERGPNYFIMPFIEGRPLRRSLFGRTYPHFLTLKQTREMADLLRLMFSRGFDPVDLGPHNMLVDKSGRISVIDFEFVHRCGGPVQPEQSACLGGIGDAFEGEWPPKARWVPKRAKSLDPWRLRWFGCTGLSLRSFLYDPPWLQRGKRLVNYPAYLAGKVIADQAQRVRARVRPRRR